MLNDTLKEYKDDIQDVETFCESIYNDMFAPHFVEIHNLYSKMKSKVNPISDRELEYILIALPMELFTAAEKLNKLRLDYEVIKLKNKKKIEEFRTQYGLDCTDWDVSKTAKVDYVNRSTNLSMVDYEMIVSAYDSIIARVSNEQAFAKELIMGAKKVWDSRKAAESSNPVKPIASDLPDYDPTSGKAYIK